MLFVCARCECVDDSELAFLGGAMPTHPDNMICTLCSTGTWHNQFPHSLYDPEHDHVVNRPTGIGLG